MLHTFPVLEVKLAMNSIQAMIMKSPLKRLLTAGVLAFTLGLAPFHPSPHILGKIKWVMGGGVGMQPMDIFDLFLHGAPWIYLLLTLIETGIFYGKRIIHS